MKPTLLLALDQGTTGTRAYVLDAKGAVLGSAYREFTQYFPSPGWVEHDALEIWDSVQATGARALRAAGLSSRNAPRHVAGLGLTNQRETVVAWSRRDGRPVHRAIVWQCRRTAGRCEQLKARGLEPMVRRRTGLVLDAYFSGTKAEWLLKRVPGAARAAASGALALGTIDSWLLWKLSDGAIHATDHTNASRTLLYDIRKKAWDPGLLELFHVPPRGPTHGAGLGLPLRFHVSGGLLRGGHPHHRRGRRPAGRALRPGLRGARLHEEHLRHGLLPAHEPGPAL